ncbi:YxeA family protein [Bacillus cereus group sp. TH43LC]|uniref:YxeA family protein n=1 Tax=Bacillus cereus group TaxID=86661 RepID=UPI0022E6E6E0|nr:MULTISPECIES: YxeA family protein [unclassified Bacillus cereus group]MDA1502559.1 YxeA family protein [Bacillus cereus group sp. TH43LC]MDA1789791.1 YxeA family protein [Bacillus cereus group sp. BY5-1LC]MDA1864169.1 YxeA family protein [Bacillus cereus group sp. BY128LC]
MKRFIFGSLLVIVAGAAYLLSGSATVDSMNPFLKLEYRYAVIDNDGKDLGGNKGRVYTVNTYDKDGNEKEITIDGVDTLQKGSYWHVITRGKFVHDKVQIEEEIIPDGAKAKLGL